MGKRRKIYSKVQDYKTDVIKKGKTANGQG